MTTDNQNPEPDNDTRAEEQEKGLVTAPVTAEESGLAVTMSDPPPDRSGRLKAMAIFQFILAGFNFLFVILVILGSLLTNALAKGDTPHGLNLLSILSSVSIYGLTGFFFIVLGIGSYRRRRWIRPLVLASMWPAFLIGILTFGLVLYLVPNLFEILMLPVNSGAQVPSAILGVIQVIIIAWSFFMLVAIPGLHVVAYQGKSLERYLKSHNPKESFWTKNRAISILSLAFVFASLSLMTLLTLGYTFSIFFGIVITGPIAVAITLLESAIYGITAFLVLRRSMRGFWLGVGVVIYFYAKYAITFLFLDIKDIYGLTGTMSKKDLEIMDQFWNHLPITAMIEITSAVLALTIIGYMFAVKKQFDAEKTAPIDGIDR